MERWYLKSGPRPAPGSFSDQLVAVIPRVRRFCLALTGSRDAGDDLLQSVLERALLRQAQFQAGTRLDHWLYRIARNLRIDLMRAERSRGGPGESLDEAADVVGSDGLRLVEARSQLAHAGRAFMALPGNHREVFALVVLDGCTYREAADLLELPLGTVMSRIARSRAAMEEFMQRPVGTGAPENGH